MTGRSMAVCWFAATGLFGQNAAYVVDNALGQVKVIDLARRSVIATIPAGPEASEMFILPNNRIAVAANQGDHTAAVLDLRSNQRIAVIPAGQSPSSLIGSSDGRFVYIANGGSNDVTVIDVASRAAIATVPVDVTPVQVNLSPDGRFVYAVNQDASPTGTITVIDTRRNRVAKTVAVGLRPAQFAISPIQTTAYVINSGSDNVSVFDLAANTVIATIAVGRGPANSAFSADGHFLYVVNRAGNSISVVDTRVNRAVAQISVGVQPAGIAVTFDAKFAYVGNQGSNSVSVLDLTANTSVATINAGNGPFDLVLDPNEDFLYVTNLGSQSVSVIDTNTDAVVSTIPTGGTPIQFAFPNAPTLLEVAPNPTPAGGQITLGGEGFLPGSTVRVITTTPPRTFNVSPTFLDSEGLRITLPSIPGASSASVVVDNPDGDSSETVAVRLGSPGPSIVSGGVVEAAGFQAAPNPISAGAFVAIFSLISGISGVSTPGFPLPTTLNDTRVTFNGVPAPLYYVGPEVISAVVPVALVSSSSVRVAVSLHGQTGPVETVNVATTSPGIFMIDSNGSAAARHGSRPLDIVTSADPAERGETIALYLTGLGPTLPSSFDGEVAPSDVFSPTVNQPTVLIGGVPAKIYFSGLTPEVIGLYQINLEVPASTAPGPSVSVTVSFGVKTSNVAKLAIK